MEGLNGRFQVLPAEAHVWLDRVVPVDVFREWLFGFDGSFCLLGLRRTVPVCRWPESGDAAKDVPDFMVGEVVRIG